MTLLRQLQQKFREALAPLAADPEPYVALVKPTADPKLIGESRRLRLLRVAGASSPPVGEVQSQQKQNGWPAGSR